MLTLYECESEETECRECGKSFLWTNDPADCPRSEGFCSDACYLEYGHNRYIEAMEQAFPEGEL